MGSVTTAARPPEECAWSRGGCLLAYRMVQTQVEPPMLIGPGVRAWCRAVVRGIRGK